MPSRVSRCEHKDVPLRCMPSTTTNGGPSVSAAPSAAAAVTSGNSPRRPAAAPVPGKCLSPRSDNPQTLQQRCYFVTNIMISPDPAPYPEGEAAIAPSAKAGHRSYDDVVPPSCRKLLLKT